MDAQQQIEHAKINAMITVMQAYLDGKPIEYMNLKYPGASWSKCMNTPMWDWKNYDYHIAPLVKPSIDWSQIPDQFRWLAVDASGKAYVYSKEPSIERECLHWSHGMDCKSIQVDHIHTSFNRGTVDWRDSLVERI